MEGCRQVHPGQQRRSQSTSPGETPEERQDQSSNQEGHPGEK